MFRSAKLRTKMFGGFFAVIGLVIAVGLMAVSNINSVGVESRHLADIDIPEVKADVDLQRDLAALLLSARSYHYNAGSTTEAACHDQLKAVQSSLQKFSDLAKSLNDSTMAAVVEGYRKEVGKFEALFNESVALNKQLSAARQAGVAASEEFTAKVNEYLQEQDRKLRQEIKDAVEPAKLEERVQIIRVANDGIDLVNHVRVANQRAQAQRDPSIIQASIPDLRKATACFEQILQITTADADRRAINGMVTAIANWQKAAELTLELDRQLEKVVADRAAASMGVVEAIGVSTSKTLDRTIADADSMSDHLGTASTTLITGLVVALVLAVAIAWFITAGILKAVTPVLNRALEIANNDLTGSDLPKRSEDELGQLTDAVNRMSGSLRKVVSEVADSAREVASASTEIASSSEEMASGMNEQTQQVTQISSAIEEMSASIVEVARKSADAAGNAGESGKVATEGGKIVAQTIEGMQSISRAVTASATSVQELGKRGEQIGQIIEVINDIADQTNLLALKAAIEAARAGEHGRGFAVVADEVRKLADRTTKATEEIAGSIKAIQTETTQAVERMNAGTQEVQNGVESATRAGKSLEAIVTSAQSVASMIQSIAAAAEQQSAASEQVSRNVESISSVTRQASEGAGQAAAAATQLSSKAEQLQRLVGSFKLAH